MTKVGEPAPSRTELSLAGTTKGKAAETIKPSARLRLVFEASALVFAPIAQNKVQAARNQVEADRAARVKTNPSGWIAPVIRPICPG